MTIYKYTLMVGPGIEIIKVPHFAKPLTVQLQHGIPTVWVELDETRQDTQEMKFHTVGTGWPLDENKHVVYVGTYQLNGYVWHVYRE